MIDRTSLTFTLALQCQEERLEFGLSCQLSLSGWPHNLTTRFWPPLTTVVSPELLPHCAGSLRCLPEDMATGRLWPVPVENCKQCLTSLIPLCWQSWLVACPSCSLQMMMLLHGWPPTMAARGGCTWRQKQQASTHVKYVFMLTVFSHTAVLWPLYKSTRVSRHLQLRSGGFCWSKVLLAACLC